MAGIVVGLLSTLGVCCMAHLLTETPSNANPPDAKTGLLAHKTELIGELTQAMANQFNNTMMAITSYAELEMKKLPPSQRRSLEQVLDNTARATALVQKLLDLSLNRGRSPQELHLNSTLSGIRYLIEQLVGERISVVYRLDSSIPPVRADPAEVDQLVLSLAINARNAMSKGGTLQLRTEQVCLTADAIGESERPGEYVMLSVDDTGNPAPAAGQHDTGTDQDSRINLSLAAVRSVVKSANGIARFSSDPGKGSSFKIYFPALSQNAGVEQGRTSPRQVPMARAVLIVEDDDAVRIPTSELLKMEGFKVLQARTGEEAIQLVTQKKPLLDILITDIVMPRMSGHEVAEKLLELHPGLKVLYMSGDAQEIRPSQNAHRARHSTLRKPFRLDLLKDKIHELLGE